MPAVAEVESDARGAPGDRDAPGQWSARLALQVVRRDDRTRLRQSRHHGPLYVQKPFYPEGAELPHIYLLHPPGGMVSGDELVVDVDLGADAMALGTTPGAGRAYRARAGDTVQTQRTRLKLAAGASLEWFPLETILYNGARARLQTEIELAEGARFCGWDITCFGLPARNEVFSTGSCDIRYRIFRDGRPMLIENTCVDAESRVLLNASAGLRGHAVNGLFVCGPDFGAETHLLDQLRSAAAEAGAAESTAISVVGEFCVGRYLGNSADTARRIFATWWRLLRPQYLGRQACAPRIWAT